MIKYLGSSADSSKVSLTVKGILVAIVAVLAAVGIDTSEWELNSVIDAVVNAIDAVAGAVSAIMVVYGIGRKFYYKYKEPKERIE